MRKFKKIFSYLYRNYFLPKFLSYKYKNLLSRNGQLKDTYRGKRCFIIGGGPSVKELDLSKLKDEYTFVMSEFDKNPQYKALNPKFHTICDTAYFTDGSEYWNGLLRKKNEDIDLNTAIFVNIGAKDFIKKNRIFSNHNFYYIGMQGIISEYFPFNIDIDRFIPWPKNSALLCLILATYLGFSEIYLLGCEHNFLCFNIGAGKAVSYSHSYDSKLDAVDTKDTEALKKVAVSRDLDMTYEDNISHILQLFKNYRLFYKKIKQSHPNTKIFNATPNSYLDVFPIIDYKNIR